MGDCGVRREEVGAAPRAALACILHMRPFRRVSPIFGSGDKPGADGIGADIGPDFLQLIVVPYSMVEGISLPVGWPRVTDVPFA